MRRLLLLALAGAAAGFALPSESTQAHVAVPTRLQPGGDYLTYNPVSGSPAPFLETTWGFREQKRGRELFYRDWSEPEPGKAMRLGPAYDASRCTSCHVETSDDPSLPIPVVFRTLGGTQVNTQHLSSDAVVPRIVVEWTEKSVELSDGKTVALRKPAAYRYENGEKEPLAMRMPPLLFGWGLLENADVEFLQYLDDPTDRNGDGISGRMTTTASGEVAVMGWNNSHATVRDQVAAALMSDIGISSNVACGLSCTNEISLRDLDALTDYVRLLPVPNRRLLESRRGQDLFGFTGCADCHTSVVLTRPDGPKPFAGQLTWPFSDLMLHDMGPGLADTPDSREWRTSPLWGIGYIEKAFPHRGFLHDGRARNIEEAILWHDGEAASSQARYKSLSAEDRGHLLEFVRSL